jgi:hypothetical protein
MQNSVTQCADRRHHALRDFKLSLFWDVMQRNIQKSADLFNKRSLHSKCHKVARCTRQCDFIYVHKKIRAFPAPISRKNYRQHYAQTTNIKHRPKQKINVEITPRNSFMPKSKVRLSLL